VATEAPNVLVIMSDQHNANVMGCAGDPVVQTPNLDALASRGVVLDNLYCPSPICAPSRMSFMTGMLPSHCGVMTNDELPNSARPTLAHSAGAVGYRPVLAGKLHALGPDQLQGFVDRAVGDHGPNYPGGPSPARGPLAGTAGPDVVSLQKAGRGRNAYQVRDEFAAQAAISHLERHAIEQRATGERRPFFLSVGLMLPHPPYVARAEDFDRYVGKVPMPRVPAPTTSADDHPFLNWWRQATGIGAGVPDELIMRARTAYWAMVSRMDDITGSILGTLDRLGLTDNTLIIYTSDHGDQVGEHGLWWKQTLFEASARIPGIVSWPGVIPAGGHSPRVASLIDINATIIEAIGGPRLPRSTGRSLLGALTGRAPQWEDLAITEYCVDAGHRGGVGNMEVPEGHYQRMVRSGQHKYIDYGHEPHQLFDLAADPDETTNLIASPDHAQIAASLATRARADWDPEAIKAETRTSIAETEVFRQWTAATHPIERFRWQMNPAYNSLDDDEI
jgi:choline-sulfatase